MAQETQQPERRQFMRIDYSCTLAFKVCKEETFSKLMQGYTANVSPAGLLFQVKEKVNTDDIVWLSVDRATLIICEELEKRCFIYQNGIVGKVVRVDARNDQTYDVGVQFIVREEKNVTNIFPKMHFVKDGVQELDEEEV